MTSKDHRDLTSFVGRNAELAELAELVEGRRLLTLTGVGGCGKTRLARRLLSQSVSIEEESLVSADLGALNDPTQVPGAVAHAAGVAVEAGEREALRLARRLADFRVLWLDNCEHMLEATRNVVTEVLQQCPAMTVVATSRVPLGVFGETVWQVPALLPADATQLFLDRAGLASPRFALASDHELVPMICERLDHLPLAIELAAPWVRALSLEQILEGLDRSYELLVGGPSDAAPRHQSLQASMSWSYDLLTSTEQMLFRRLSVFAGGFTLRDAVRVAQLVDDPQSPEGEACVGRPAEVVRLIDGSLLTVTDTHGEMRYEMLDTVRQFATERLSESGELKTVERRHLELQLAVAAQAERGMGENQERWQRELASRRGDLVAAVVRGIESEDESDVELAIQLIATLGRHWLLCGHVGEGARLVAETTRLCPDSPRLQGQLQATRAMLAMAAGDLDAVLEAATRGAELAHGAGDPATRARCEALRAFSQFFSDFEKCARTAADARDLALEAGDEFAADWAGVLECYSLLVRGMNDQADALARTVAGRARRRRDNFCGAFAVGAGIYTSMTRGRLSEAIRIGYEAIALARPLGEHFATGTLTGNTAHALALHGDLDEAFGLLKPIARSLDTDAGAHAVGFMVPMGLIHLWQGDPEQALDWFQRGVARLEHHERDWSAARCLPGLVAALRLTGRRAEAEAWAQRGERILETFGAPFELADLLDEYGRVVSERGAQARELHLRALYVRAEKGVPLGNASSLDGLASLAEANDDLPEAARLCVAADRVRKTMGHRRSALGQSEHWDMVNRLQASLGTRAIDAYRDSATADPNLTVAALLRGRGPRTHGTGPLASLTPSELEVARLVARGFSNPEVASRLLMSRGTVKAHLGHIYPKLGVPNRAALAALLHRTAG